MGCMKLKSSVAVVCFLPGRAKDLSAPCKATLHFIHILAGYKVKGDEFHLKCIFHAADSVYCFVCH